ncbi:MAG: AMP-binding protein [Marivivens sp.]
MLNAHPTVAETRAKFRWDIPARYNIGVDICDKWADREPERIALIDVGADGIGTEVSFGDLKARSNQLANALAKTCQRGDRIAVLLPQGVETALAHIAALKMGCVSLPLFTLFGPDALLHRLKDSGAKVVITNAEGAAKLSVLRDQLPALERVLCIEASQGAEDFHAAVADESTDFRPVDTAADDPAILIYTSGTTGNPKGALHAHRVLLGHLPGVEMSHDFFPQEGDRIWTPADWAWIGGLLDVLMPALHHGITVVSRRMPKFSALEAFDLMRRFGVRNAFLPPTALKIMRQAPSEAAQGLSLRSVASGGETLGAELIDWGRATFGRTINEFYGQTECNMIVSSCAALAPAEPGVMGFAAPGHEVEVLNEAEKRHCAIGEEGAIAVKAPDPVMFLEYWNKPEATEAKFLTIAAEKWLLTGDRGTKTPSGRIRFIGRDDDVISSAGYRIGPAEIEDCLLTHPAVQLAGVIGAPDPIRGQAVWAYVQLASGFAPSDTLAAEIAAHVRTRLSAHEYPRAVRFIDAMPMTTTGKIIRGALRALAAQEQSD